ncbi:MAG: metallophosphoesterase family protein [Alphaproteobacteria bacterium]
MFRLAHLSDVHLGPLPPVRITDLMSKRLTGYVNWHRNRSDAAGPDRLNALITDLKSYHPDHIAVTGDLVNIGLREEINRARIWLDGLGPPDAVTVIPGNHDAYVASSSADYTAAWQPFMLGDGKTGECGTSGSDPAPLANVTFPFVRRRGPIALIAVSSAIATPPFMATGAIGRAQADALGNLLRETGNEGMFRVVLIHHPPLPRSLRRRTRALTDAARFRKIVAAEGAGLVLHGHDHVRFLTEIDGPGFKVPVIGVPAAAGQAKRAGHGVPERDAGYALHEITAGNTAFHVTTIHRSSADGRNFSEVARHEFSFARSAP